MTAEQPEADVAPPALGVLLREWGRIGCLGFGGPPAHIAMLHDLCVRRRGWLTAAEFEDAVAACNLLPGPASTQMAIYCAGRVGGRRGALVGGLAFVLPGLVVILALAGVFLQDSPPRWLLGAAGGAGSAVAAIAVGTGCGLVPASWAGRVDGRRWSAYLLAGGVGAAMVGTWLVLVLLACGLLEVGVRRGSRGRHLHCAGPAAWLTACRPLHPALWSSLGWTAFKVGALSYGGGFVIIPLMQSDAVHHHWLTDSQFLNAVALGQITPGPVTHTVAVVGYGAAGVLGGLVAAVVAFAPSFALVLLGAARFDRLRADPRARAFLGGAGPAVIGAILGSAVPLALALHRTWQFAVLAAAGLALLTLRRGVVATLLMAAVAGVIVVAAGGPLP